MGALTPLGKVAGARWRWIGQVGAYTAGGAASSALLGGLLGALGALVLPASFHPPAVVAVLALATVVLLREAGVVSFSVPQLRRQTRDVWAHRFSPSVTAALWGMDVGLLFSTHLTFAGTWLLVAVAVASAQPAVGVALFLAYWAGRASSAWIAPVWLRDPGSTPRLLMDLAGYRRAFQLVHVAGIAVLTAALSVSLTGS